MRTARILVGDVRARLRDLPDQSVQCVVTSPPYWGLRDYGTTGQIGLERTPADYVTAIGDVFAEVWRVLRDDGTCWINLGDSYAGGAGGRGDAGRQFHQFGDGGGASTKHGGERIRRELDTLKPKDLCGIPWRVAFALQAAGWYLRSDIIWSKPNPMPESVTDRPTKAHEYIFLLTKSERYYFDAEAIAEPVSDTPGAQAWRRIFDPMKQGKEAAMKAQGLKGGNDGQRDTFATHRNKRSVWHVATQPYPEAHFATYPEALIEPCILAGTSERGQCPQCGAPWLRVVERTSEQNQDKWNGSGLANGCIAGGGHMGRTGSWLAKSDTLGWQPSCDCNTGEPVPQTVLDPFCGSGTTGVVACRHNRHFVGIELNQTYAELAERRIRGDASLFNAVEVGA